MRKYQCCRALITHVNDSCSTCSTRWVLGVCKLEHGLDAHAAEYALEAALENARSWEGPAGIPPAVPPAPTPDEWALGEPPLSGEGSGGSALSCGGVFCSTNAAL